MVTDPENRFALYDDLNRLLELWRAIVNRRLYPEDADLVEVFERIHTLMIEPRSAVGRTLFSIGEAEAFERFESLEVNFDALAGPWENAEVYLRSQEFEQVLKAAGECWTEMFRFGRGLPGWLTDREVFELAAEAQAREQEERRP